MYSQSTVAALLIMLACPVLVQDLNRLSPPQQADLFHLPALA